ncbi:MAG: T9SS type A sorting domain-containing protein [Gilvibacter sp.]
MSCTLMTAQDPIFNPTMDITAIGVVDSPVGEEVDKIIDGSTATKFLDFALDDGMGFIVDLGGISAIVTSIEVVTANDFPVRDPMNWEIMGSNDGSTFVPIDSGVIDCIPDRFFSRTFEFDNGIDFQWYQVNFTNACDPSGGTGIASMQLAEVQLYGAVLNLEDNVLGQQFSVYPNPVLESLIINYTGVDPLTGARLYDVLGKQVLQLDVSAFNQRESYDLSLLNSGLYFIRLQTATASTVKRIFVK